MLIRSQLNIIFKLFFALIIINVCNCGVIKDKKSDDNDKALINSLFNVNLKLQNLINNNEENFLVSPIGLSLTLAQLSLGANTYWRKLINRFMKWQKIPIHGLYTNLLVNLTTPDQIIGTLRSYEEPPAYINITSGFFYDASLKDNINGTFINTLKDVYQSEIHELPMQENFDQSQDVINNWVKSKTNDEISSFPISKQTMSLMLNTIYFEGYWFDPFDTLLTIKDNFMINDRKNTTVEYMQGQHYTLYAIDKQKLNCRLLRIPYQTQQKSIAMYILSPNDNIENLLQNLNAANFQNLKNSARIKSVDIKMPKLKIKSKVKIMDYLKEMHRQQPIEQERIDKDVVLSNLVLNNNSTTLSDIVQYVSLNVNEKGTVASAASGGIIDYSGLTIRFNINRPYVLIIQDEHTNATLFWATIYNPNNE